MWAKFSKAAKRQVNKAAKIAGFKVVSCGQTSDGSYVYGFAVCAENPNAETLKALLVSEGAFDASWL
jgi:hypothetical protein